MKQCHNFFFFWYSFFSIYWIDGFGEEAFPMETKEELKKCKRWECDTCFEVKQHYSCHTWETRILRCQCLQVRETSFYTEV